MLVDSGVFTVKHEKIMICFLICEYFHQKYWPGKVVLEFDEWIKWSGEKHLQLRLQNNFWSPQRLCKTCFNCNPIFQCRSNRILNPLNWTTHMSHPNFFMNKVVQKKTFAFRPINAMFGDYWGCIVAKLFNSSIRIEFWACVWAGIQVFSMTSPMRH